MKILKKKILKKKKSFNLRLDSKIRNKSFNSKII